MLAPGPTDPTKLVPIPTANGELHGEAFLPASPKGIRTFLGAAFPVRTGRAMANLM